MTEVKSPAERGKATQFRSGTEAARSGRKGGVESGKARRTKKIMLDVLLKALEKKMPDGRSRKESIIDALIEQCEDGNVSAINTVLDRVDGKTAPVIADDEEAVTIATVLIAARRRATQ